MSHIYPLQKKSSAEVLEKFMEYKAEVEKQTGKVIKRLRTDGGGEYEKWMGVHLKGTGIIHETTAPYSPDQNARIERSWKESSQPLQNSNWTKGCGWKLRMR
jgi:hypothetical protein